MSDSAVRPGSPDDRKLPISVSLGLGYFGSLFVGTGDWLFKDMAGGHWHLTPPDNALLGLWATGLFPVVHILGRIIMNLLSRLERETQ